MEERKRVLSLVFLDHHMLQMNTQQKIIKNKLGLLNLAETLGNVSKACSVM